MSEQARDSRGTNCFAAYLPALVIGSLVLGLTASNRALGPLSASHPTNISRICTAESDRFIVNPIHQMPGLNI